MRAGGRAKQKRESLQEKIIDGWRRAPAMGNRNGNEDDGLMDRRRSRGRYLTLSALFLSLSARLPHVTFD